MGYQPDLIMFWGVSVRWIFLCLDVHYEQPQMIIGGGFCGVKRVLTGFKRIFKRVLSGFSSVFKPDMRARAFYFKSFLLGDDSRCFQAYFQ